MLFDEIEKAHPEVLNVLLQLLDDGRLTDGKGRTIDFKNTVVIMTSNLGSGFLADLGDRGIDEGVRREVMDALRAHFRPEFINRVDEIIIFHPLNREQMKTIIDIQVKGLLKRLEERKIFVTLTDAAKEWLVREGYDPAYGARPLKRAIQRHILDPLAMRVLEGEFREGDLVQVDAGPSRPAVRQAASRAVSRRNRRSIAACISSTPNPRGERRSVPRRPSGTMWYGLALSASCSCWRRPISSCRPAGRSPTASSSRSSRRGRSPKRPSASRSSAAR